LASSAVATRGHAVVVGPPDVVGINLLDRGTPARSVALVEDLEKVGVHQFSDRGAHRETSYCIMRQLAPMQDCGGIEPATYRSASTR
jgi:hypothetical protein